MEFKLTRPCGNCPFRHDIDFYLPVGRRIEIAQSLLSDKTFPCHKTVHYETIPCERNAWSEDHSVYEYQGDEQHCAGALIALQKSSGLFSNFLLRLAYLAKMLEPSKLRLDSPVLTLEEFQEHENSRRIAVEVSWRTADE